MKLNKILSITAGILLAFGATSCSEYYLELKPEGTLDYEEVIVDNEEGATLAIYGICQSMYKQYSSLSTSSSWFNGEPFVALYYGDVVGQDYVSAFWFDDDNLMLWQSMDRTTSAGSSYAWGYYYGLISQANNIISFAPKKTNEAGEVLTDAEYNGNPVPDVEGTYAFRYAQALTLRAHSYTRLLQIYCSRYEDMWDNEKGQYQNTVPLRLEYESPQGNLTKPLAKWDVLVRQIYADLEQAIALYNEAGIDRTYIWEPNLPVAQGLLARVAMINQDWKTAMEMARAARAKFPLMSMEEYQAGFAEPNGEWMWASDDASQGLYYYSFGATYACNGAYPCAWGTIGAGAISNDLIKQAINLDQRAVLFYSPRNVSSDIRSRFWGSECNSDNMDINFSQGALHRDFVRYCGIRMRTVNSTWAPPYTYTGYPYTESGVYTTCTALFGAQFKFWGTDNYSASSFPYMRGAEMYLIEAEAAYMDNNPTLANELLTELNEQRIRNYDEEFVGEEILEQIKLSKRLELWGEGFSWFDLKRWNEPIKRNAWVRNNSSSGNWPLRVAIDYPASYNRGWRWRIPTVELNYNDAIDRTEAETSDR